MLPGQLTAAQAEWALVEEHGVNVTAGLEAALGLFGTDGASFGTCRFDLRTGDVEWTGCLATSGLQVPNQRLRKECQRR